MPGPDDKPEPDALAEWADSEPTVIDGAPLAEGVPQEFSDQVTRASDLAPMLEDARARGVEDGCRSCFSEGQADALIALRSLLLERGATNEHTVHVVAAVRKRMTKL